MQLLPVLLCAAIIGVSSLPWRYNSKFSRDVQTLTSAQLATTKQEPQTAYGPPSESKVTSEAVAGDERQFSAIDPDAELIPIAKDGQKRRRSDAVFQRQIYSVYYPGTFFVI